MVFECPAMQPVRDRFPALFGAHALTMQQFMWQLNLVGVAHFVMYCFDMLDAPDANESSHQP